MRYIIVFLQFFMLISCSTQINQSNYSNKETQFQSFIKRQKIIQLPARIELYKSNYSLAYPEFSDTSIFNETTSMGTLGILEDTSKFYYVIPMYPGDDLLPFLYVFEKNGEIIDKSGLFVGKYGNDCGCYTYGYTTISKSLKIFTQDSAAVYFCDSIGNEFRDSLSVYISSQEMVILNNGKVKQEKVVERIIK